MSTDWDPDKSIKEAKNTEDPGREEEIAEELKRDLDDAGADYVDARRCYDRTYRELMGDSDIPEMNDFKDTDIDTTHGFSVDTRRAIIQLLEEADLIKEKYTTKDGKATWYAPTASFKQFKLYAEAFELLTEE